jgi:hypothetical protein
MNAAPGQPPSPVSQHLVFPLLLVIASAVVTALLDSLPRPVVWLTAIAIAIVAAYYSTQVEKVRLAIAVAGIAVAVGIAIGLMIARLFGGDPPPPQSVATTPVAVQITKPTNELNCANQKEKFCIFTVEGTMSGFDPAVHRIYVFIKPTKPSGEGWYPQVQPADDNDGRWSQTQSQVGSDAAPAQAGHELQVRAAIVRSDATYNSAKLTDLAGGEAVRSLQDIDGVISLSEPVTLVVKR